ncbi:cyclic nucleotide-binding domain-containing protein 1-like [Clavelina lepadiformis]|uniref:cyclic nucleotide-binding domain-containing protein 1-like n=1 Tax=Clavelina lepadiformis TaxID=159417 RepID=UPI0040425879
MQSCIDYNKLKIVNSVVSLDPKQVENKARHDVLMTKFKSIFLRPPKNLPKIPNKTTKSFERAHQQINRPKSRYAAQRKKVLPKVNADPPTPYDDPVTHDVRYHVSNTRRARSADGVSSNDDVVLHRERNLGVLRLLMKKLPFERTRREHKRVYQLLRDLWPTELASMLDDVKKTYPVVRELASVATVDHYSEAGLTVFGNSGLYLILRGSVRPQTVPYIREGMSTDNDSENFPCPTPLLRRKQIKLQPGDWFGTLQKVEGREINSKVLSVVTAEPCQFLKISVADYKRILTRIEQRVLNEKTAVVQATAPYNKWPGLSVGKLARLIEWKTVTADTVIAEEGEIAPFIVFFRRGECNIFKQVEAIKTLASGRKRRILKTVLMGQLTVGDALGEDSILEQRPLSCTVMTSTEVELGVIEPYKLDLLDVTTRTLLGQSVQPKFSEMSEDEIHANFVRQEMRDDWDRLKHKVLLQTINHCGIRPGYGKWANPLIKP